MSHAQKSQKTERKMMRRKAISLCLLAILLFYQLPLAVAQQNEKITIAVVDFYNTGRNKENDYLMETIPESIVTTMAKSGKIEIVERARLKETLDEMVYNMAGIIDEKTAAKVGKAVGANAILLGSFAEIEKEIQINARLIDVETSKIIAAESVRGTLGKDNFALMDEIAESMEQKLFPPPEEPKIEKPFYKKWWFWTITGVAVAGGVFAATYDSEDDETGGKVTIWW
jgi:TolB-like protein